MARAQRLDVAGGVYHVMVRGADRALLFRDDEERTVFLDRVGEVLDWGGAACLGWALMPNHVHLVVVRGVRTLGQVMHRVGSWWAGYLNRKDGRRSARLDGRYKAILVDADEHLTELVRYVHLNPVKAGLTELSGLSTYPWTGYRALMGEGPPGFLAVDEVLGHFGARRGAAREALAAWLADGLANVDWPMAVERSWWPVWSGALVAPDSTARWTAERWATRPSWRPPKGRRKRSRRVG